MWSVRRVWFPARKRGLGRRTTCSECRNIPDRTLLQHDLCVRQDVIAVFLQSAAFGESHFRDNDNAIRLIGLRKPGRPDGLSGRAGGAAIDLFDARHIAIGQFFSDARSSGHWTGPRMQPQERSEVSGLPELRGKMI